MRVPIPSVSRAGTGCNVDDVGGVTVAGVYCTLCGSMILYKTVHNGINPTLGASGFLYRSNKLMYDKGT